MKNVTKLAKKSAGLSQKCSICPLMKRCTLEIQRACFDSFVEGFKKGARAAEDIMDGWCCQLCGVYFEEEHGYPVVCESCYNELSEEEKKDYQLATHKEF